MRSDERRKVNVVEMKCVRSLVGVSRMDSVRNEVVLKWNGSEVWWECHEWIVLGMKWCSNGMRVKFGGSVTNR